MALLLSDPYGYLDILLLVFVRVLGLLLIVPILSNKSVPYITKIAFSFFLTLIIISTIDFPSVTSSTDLVNYAILVTKEFITGWLMGFGAYMVFAVLSLAGQFIDSQIGFSMVNVFDPMSQIQLTITGNLYYYVLIIIAIIMNAHHLFIRALIDSFSFIPLGEIVLSADLHKTIIDFVTRYFALSLQIAAPIFFIMIITNVVLGILARTVPQLNMFVIGFPIKILFGLLTVYLTLSMFSWISDTLIGESEQMMRDIIKGMRP